MNGEKKYNLWVRNNLALEDATWQQVMDYMGENGVHKDDCDLEEVSVEEDLKALRDLPFSDEER